MTVCFGSLAALFGHSSLMAAFGRTADVPLRIFDGYFLNVRFHPKRSFKHRRNRQYDRPLSAKCGHQENPTRFSSSPAAVGVVVKVGCAAEFGAVLAASETAALTVGAMGSIRISCLVVSPGVPGFVPRGSSAEPTLFLYLPRHLLYSPPLSSGHPYCL